MHDFTGASARSARIIGEAPPSISPAEDAGRKQAKINWLESSITQEVIKDMHTQATEFIELAVRHAVSYPTAKNHDIIIQLLVRADQTRKLVNKYATTE